MATRSSASSSSQYDNETLGRGALGQAAERPFAMCAVGGGLALLLIGQEGQGGRGIEDRLRKHRPQQAADLGKAQAQTRRGSEAVQRVRRVDAGRRARLDCWPPLSGSAAVAAEPRSGAPG
jgi:hypothetical protein